MPETNVPITAGTGTAVRVDKIGDDNWQIVKLANGLSGATGTVHTDTGSKDHALRTVPASDIPTGTYVGDVRVSGVLLVTGTFFQSKQPVSIPDAIGVSGTFWQAKQPVSIPDAIGISGSFGVTPNSVFGVTGTFFQSNQPTTVVNSIGVSGTVVVSPSSIFGVTGTFYQSNQPVTVVNSIGVSGTAMVSPTSVFGVTGSVTVLPGAIFGVTGSFSATPIGARSVLVTGTITNGAYSASDVVGGLLTFPNAVSGNGKRAVINSIKITGVVALAWEIWFFNADLATPRADNAIFGIAAADGAKFLGAVPISTTDWLTGQTAFNNAILRGVGLQVQAASADSNIYAYIKTTVTTSPGTTLIYVIVDFEYLD